MPPAPAAPPPKCIAFVPMKTFTAAPSASTNFQSDALQCYLQKDVFARLANVTRGDLQAKTLKAPAVATDADAAASARARMKDYSKKLQERPKSAQVVFKRVGKKQAAPASAPKPASPPEKLPRKPELPREARGSLTPSKKPARHSISTPVLDQGRGSLTTGSADRPRSSLRRGRLSDIVASSPASRLAGCSPAAVDPSEAKAEAAAPTCFAVDMDDAAEKAAPDPEPERAAPPRKAAPTPASATRPRTAPAASRPKAKAPATPAAPKSAPAASTRAKAAASAEGGAVRAAAAPKRPAMAGAAAATAPSKTGAKQRPAAAVGARPATAPAGKAKAAAAGNSEPKKKEASRPMSAKAAAVSATRAVLLRRAADSKKAGAKPVPPSPAQIPLPPSPSPPLAPADSAAAPQTSPQHSLPPLPETPASPAVPPAPRATAVTPSPPRPAAASFQSPPAPDSPTQPCGPQPDPRSPPAAQAAQAAQAAPETPETAREAAAVESPSSVLEEPQPCSALCTPAAAHLPPCRQASPSGPGSLEGQLGEAPSPCALEVEGVISGVPSESGAESGASSSEGGDSPDRYHAEAATPPAVESGTADEQAPAETTCTPTTGLRAQSSFVIGSPLYGLMTSEPEPEPESSSRRLLSPRSRALARRREEEGATYSGLGPLRLAAGLTADVAAELYEAILERRTLLEETGHLVRVPYCQS
eukprot:tig00020614_g12210.t2